MGAAIRRLGTRPTSVEVPVICVGNLTVGGTGKTPMVTALAERLAARNPHIVSRGHGGTITGPHRVDTARDSAADVGDEPLLLARHAPVWVARNRALGAAAAVDAGAGLIVLDDGMQNPSLVKDLQILIIDAAQGLGNGRVLPAGPLREPVAAGLARTDIVVLLGNEEARRNCLARWPCLDRMPRVEGSIEADDTGQVKNRRLFAFAGIGRPGKFFDSLRACGADLAGTQHFADHHPYSDAEIRSLRQEASRLRAGLITTAKDFVRLSDENRQGIETLPVSIRLADWAAIDDLIRAI